MLQCVAVCCSVLQCVAACCSVLQCVAVCCSVLQCVAVRCSMLQCVAVCCSVSQYVTPRIPACPWNLHDSLCICTLCCSVLQLCSSVLQYAALCGYAYILQHTTIDIQGSFPGLVGPFRANRKISSVGTTYGVATISRLLKIISLFAKYMSLL